MKADAAPYHQFTSGPEMGDGGGEKVASGRGAKDIARSVGGRGDDDGIGSQSSLSPSPRLGRGRVGGLPGDLSGLPQVSLMSLGAAPPFFRGGRIPS